MPTVYELASAAAHKIAAVLIENAVAPPDAPVTASAKIEGARLQVVVIVSSYEPATISPDTLARIEAMSAAAPPRMTPTMKKILAVLVGEPPRKATWIALKLGKKTADGGLREALADMLRMGVLVRGAGNFGYCLPPTPTTSAP